MKDDKDDKDEERGEGVDCVAPQDAVDAVLASSDPMPEDSVSVRGFDFELGRGGSAEEKGKEKLSHGELLSSMMTTGFQATSFGQAVAEVERMRTWRLSDEEVTDSIHDIQDPSERARTGCKIFLGFTSNLISSGVRETIRFLVKNKMVDVLVTTAGGVEEDLIKCLGKTYLADFALRGAELRKKGLNRIGNLVVPNENYCAFEDWTRPILDAMLEEQQRDGVVWTPSKVIKRLGKEINDEDSVYYWCYKNDINVYCPALTDGSLGDMFYFHSHNSPGLVVDIVGDIRAMNDEAVKARPRKTGMIILGGGVAKHHTCNANLMRNGADFAVFVNTAQEFDGSDSGARPDEAVSWGKIRVEATPVKVYGDATILFPLLVAQTFAKDLF